MFTSLFGEQSASEKKKVDNLLRSYFTTLAGYNTSYSTYDGAVYEMGLCRAIIHRLASECAKATPKISYEKGEEGKLSRRDKQKLFMISKRPNKYMTAYQFYYRLATIYYAENNAFIIPIFDEFEERVIGLFPVANSEIELKEYNGVTYIVYTFADGEKKAIEYNKCGHLRRMQYKNDFFGESHDAFKNTADLILAQEEGSARAIKSSSYLRFMAKLSTPIDDEEDYKEQQKLLHANNLDNNESGVFLFDPRFEEMRQIEGKPLLLDGEQKKAIDDSAFNYWGVNQAFLQCNYDEEGWDAIYESQLETFFIQAGEVITKIIFSYDEQYGEGKEVMLSSDRLQYASTKTKFALTKDYFDRSIINKNEARAIINLPPIKGGDKYFIRAEYVEMNEDGTPKEYRQVSENENGGKEVDGDGDGNAQENITVQNGSTTNG